MSHRIEGWAVKAGVRVPDHPLVPAAVDPHDDYLTGWAGEKSVRVWHSSCLSVRVEPMKHTHQNKHGQRTMKAGAKLASNAVS